MIRCAVCWMLREVKFSRLKLKPVATSYQKPANHPASLCSPFPPHSRYQAAFPSSEEFLREQTKILEAGEKLNPELAFCHLDFHPQNMLLVNDDDDEGNYEGSGSSNAVSVKCLVLQIKTYS